jgi:hypothetical protein
MRHGVGTNPAKNNLVPDREIFHGRRSTGFLANVLHVRTIFIIAGAFIYFLRTRRNRDIAADALAGGDHPRVNKGADGALPDLLGVTVFAFIAMALLTIGFKSKPASEQAQNPPLVGQQMQQK